MDRAEWRRVVRFGPLAGVAVIYLALVGMVEAFNTRYLIGGAVTLGNLLLVLPQFVGAYILVRPRVVGGERVTLSPRAALAGGAMSGLLAGALTGAFVAIASALPESLDARKIFVSVTPALLSIMTFGRGTAAGVVELLLLSVIAGTFGAGLGMTTWRVRRPVMVGLSTVLIMGLFQVVFRVALSQLGLSTTWLYSVAFGGLTYLGALMVFAVSTGVTAAWVNQGRTARERFRAIPEQGQKPVRLMIIAAIAFVLAVLPFLLGSFLSAVLGRVGLFILMGLGLNIVVGYAGLLDLGYVAFFAVGAYATGVLTAAQGSGSSIHVGMGFFEALLIVIAIGALTGLLIGAPVLRLRGDYLAIVTLAFGEIARVLVTSDWLKPLLGGAQGLILIPAPKFFGIDFRDPQPFYYLALAFCLFAAFLSYRLANSRIGRAWVAMREDEQIAEAMGISTVRYKLLAFAAGAAVGSMSGALFAVQIGSLSPASFNILVSITALAIIILGGMGSIPGVIVGALFLVGVPGFLSEFEQFQLLIYGAVLIAIMLYRPEGLIPNVRRTRELHEEERMQDVWAKGVPETEPSTISWEETPS